MTSVIVEKVRKRNYALPERRDRMQTRSLMGVRVRKWKHAMVMDEARV